MSQINNHQCEPSVTISIKELRDLKKNVSKLDKTEQLEVFKILKSGNGKLTENKNGIFINLTSISRDTFNIITQFVEYSIDNRSRLKNLEKLSEDLFQKSILKKQYDNYDVDTQPTPSTNNITPTVDNDRSFYYEDDEVGSETIVNDDAHKLSESLRQEHEPDTLERVESISDSRQKVSWTKARIIKK